MNTEENVPMNTEENVPIIDYAGRPLKCALGEELHIGSPIIEIKALRPGFGVGLKGVITDYKHNTFSTSLICEGVDRYWKEGDDLITFRLVSYKAITDFKALTKYTRG